MVSKFLFLKMKVRQFSVLDKFLLERRTWMCYFCYGWKLNLIAGYGTLEWKGRKVKVTASCRLIMEFSKKSP